MNSFHLELPVPEQVVTTITQQAVTKLLQVCKAALPQEACGFLAARMPLPPAPSCASPPVEYVIALVNTSSTPTHTFHIQPAAYVQALYAMQKNRQQAVGFFHSHPAGSTHLSSADLAGWSLGSRIGCWVVSLADSAAPQLALYQITHKVRKPLPITVCSSRHTNPKDL